MVEEGVHGVVAGIEVRFFASRPEVPSAQLAQVKVGAVVPPPLIVTVQPLSDTSRSPFTRTPPGSLIGGGAPSSGALCSRPTRLTTDGSNPRRRSDS